MLFIVLPPLYLKKQLGRCAHFGERACELMIADAWCVTIMFPFTLGILFCMSLSSFAILKMGCLYAVIWYKPTEACSSSQSCILVLALHVWPNLTMTPPWPSELFIKRVIKSSHHCFQTFRLLQEDYSNATIWLATLPPFFFFFLTLIGNVRSTFPRRSLTVHFDNFQNPMQILLWVCARPSSAILTVTHN